MTFYEILRQAIKEFSETGFDSEVRLKHWSDIIKRAAQADLIPVNVMEQAVRSSLGSVYKRLVENHGILKFHVGVERYTIDRIKPQLRAELDRRIMASANLIKLNRAQMVDATVRRFEGWATSIPVGGSQVVERTEEAQKIKKALVLQTYEQRRVAIDQGNKLAATISEIVAVEGGALAAVWHSRWRVPGYDYRIDHRERDQHIYTVRGNWALEKGLMKAGPDGYTDDITHPAEEVFCFPGDSRIPFADGVDKAFRRWYSGELTEIITSSGESLRGTPNHPVLTSKGWVKLGSLQEGDDVIEVSDELFLSMKHNKDNAVPLISEIFGTLNAFGATEVRSGQIEQFHGDGQVNTDVDIVKSTRPLSFGLKPRNGHGFKKLDLSKSLMGAMLMAGIGALYFFLDACLSISTRVMSGPRNCTAIFLGGVLKSDRLRLIKASRCDSLIYQTTYNRAPGHSDSLCDSLNSFARKMRLHNFIGIKINAFWAALNAFANVKPSTIYSTPQRSCLNADDLSNNRDRLPFATKATNVIKVNKIWFSGHVYNLQTEHGWYVTNNILTHNCQCRYTFLHGLRDLEKHGMLTKKGIEALAEARRKIASL